ncbi:MAG TPA: lipopolysaccharide heptosyltransferase II [Candidatus Acidoferrales bacterium]|nr:lipopolysaccharide heptosyltransferase II [Candidatus Acidoferrales bacterium]
MNSPSATSHPPSAPRILIRGVNWLGDAVMTIPALMRLRETFPDSHVALLTPEKLKDLWISHPAVNETIPFVPGESIFAVGRKLRRWGEATDEPVLARQSIATTAREDHRRAGQAAHPTRFDLALVLPNSPRSAMEMWLAGIPRRIGYARPWRNFFLTQAIPPRAEAMRMRKLSVAEIKNLISQTQDPRPKTPSTAHQIHEYLNLAAALDAKPEPLPPQLFVSPEEVENVKKKFGLDKITQPIFGLNPGAEYGPAKRWPAERFIAVAKEIQKRTNCIWLIFGGKNDTDIANQIEYAIRNPQFAIRNLSGQTSLRELMSLVKLSRVLLTNDSGPMHVAAALGTPVVVPFGSTSPELTGPGLPGDSRHHLLKSDAPCSPCFRRECPIDFRCLNGISVERVVEAALAIHPR